MTPSYFLLVEDDWDDADFVRQALHQLQAGTDGRPILAWFTKGDDLLRHLAATLTPDSSVLVLLDINLPGKDGLEILTALRANPATASLRVAGYSGNTDPALRDRFMALGGDAFFIKPDDAETFIQRVIRLVNRPEPEAVGLGAP